MPKNEKVAEVRHFGTLHRLIWHRGLLFGQGHAKPWGKIACFGRKNDLVGYACPLLRYPCRGCIF